MLDISSRGKKGQFLGRRKRPKELLPKAAPPNLAPEEAYSLERLGAEYNINFDKAGKPEEHFPAGGADVLWPPHQVKGEKKSE